MALITIGAAENDDAETVMEHFEDALFELNTYFMRRAFIPKLSSIRRKRLMELAEAAETLQLEFLKNGTPESEQDQSSERIKGRSDSHGAVQLAAVVERYNAYEARIKQKLANSTDPRLSISLYQDWERICEAFAQQFCEAYEQQFGKMNPDPEAKLSDLMIFNELDNKWDAEVDGPDALMHRYYSRLLKILA